MVMTERWVPPRRWQYDRGMFLTSDGGRAFTRDDLLELQRAQRPQSRQEAPLPPAGPPMPPKAETAVPEAPEPYAPGVGARLGLEAKRMMRERGVMVEAFGPLPLAPPSDGPVLVRGVASRVEIDDECMMLMPFALEWDSARLPPLRLRHGTEVVGDIIALEYSRLGDELRIDARVDDPEAARAPAFSIAFTPAEYELVDRGGRTFHFRVTRARLDECSLTTIPALRSALVEVRAPASPNTFTDPRYRAIQNQIARLLLEAA
jgi:hypothetical protein